MEKEKEIIDAEIVDAEIVEASANLPAVRTVANSQGTEIVTYGANGEILDCKFPRVDFNMPSTILLFFIIALNPLIVNRNTIITSDIRYT